MIRIHPLRWVVLSTLLLAGCVQQQASVKRASVLSEMKVESRDLYRGLKTGMKPSQVWRLICKRWSLGNCARLRPVALRQGLGLTGMQPYLPDLKIFAYQGQSELRCTHYLYFRAWGLMAVRVECKADYFAQIRSMLRRYKRWYSRPSKVRLLGTTYIYRWARKGSNQWRVDLFVRRRKSTALHLDLSRRWYDIASNLEPSIERSDAETVKLWKKVPTKVKREVLENVGRLIDRLKSMHLKSPFYRLYSTPWSPSRAEHCEPTKSGLRWKASAWRNIGFEPAQLTRMRYRLVRKFHFRRIGSRRAQRNFKIDVEGCGFKFRLSLKKSGVDWIYDPLVLRELLVNNP